MLNTPPSLGVDTSLQSSGLASDLQADAPGISSTSAPWLDGGALFPPVSQQDFSAAVGGDPGKSFSSQVTSDASNRTTKGGLRGDVVSYAKQFLGMQYKWGGSNPNTSFDCSGFVQYVLKHFGVNVPRVSFQQARYGQTISLSQARAGDLIAWDNSSRNNGADHIALYLGNGQIMEFYRTGKPSRIRQLGKNENYWAVQINYPGEK